MKKKKKEFGDKVEIIHNDLVFGDNSYTKDFIKAKINQVIDDMIGEEKDELPNDDNFINTVNAGRIGYNQKVSELKEYKKKWNK